VRTEYRRPAIQTASVALVGVLIVAASAAGYFAITTSKSTANQSTTYNAAETYNACTNQGISGSCAAGDIVNGPVTINASQYNFYQFDIPYGAQDIAVHVQWSSEGTIGVYLMNATELIDWQGGHGLRTFYNSGLAQLGDLNLQVPPDDLYYLVFDNSLSSAARNVQATSGFSFMCGLCSAAAPIQQLSKCSGLHRRERKRSMLGGSFEPRQQGGLSNRDLHRVLER
jgi:hypothetical protein